MNTIQKFIMKLRIISLKRSAKEQVKQFYYIQNQLIQRLQCVSEQQTKYYNIKHQSKNYAVSDLMLLLIKNLK